MRTLILALAVSVCAAAASDYKLEQREPVSHTFGAASSLDIDMVSGNITIVADSANSIRIEGEKVMRAATQDQMDRAKREVALDANEKNGVAQLYANGPFRNNNSHASEDHGFHEHNERHYDVAFNITAHVPRAIALRLRSVNGFIKGDGTGGAFDIGSVNGPVTLTNLAGAGSVNTVNGEIRITFRDNPKSDSSFKTVNGAIEAGFKPGLNANVAVKTMNGGAFTDFEATARMTPASTEARNGKRIFRTDKLSNLQIGTGGPELRFETLNGEIRIRKQ